MKFMEIKTVDSNNQKKYCIYYYNKDTIKYIHVREGDDNSNITKIHTTTSDSIVVHNNALFTMDNNMPFQLFIIDEDSYVYINTNYLDEFSFNSDNTEAHLVIDNIRFEFKNKFAKSAIKTIDDLQRDDKC